MTSRSYKVTEDLNQQSSLFCPSLQLATLSSYNRLQTQKSGSQGSNIRTASVYKPLLPDVNESHSTSRSYDDTLQSNSSGYMIPLMACGQTSQSNVSTYMAPLLASDSAFFANSMSSSSEFLTPLKHPYPAGQSASNVVSYHTSQSDSCDRSFSTPVVNFTTPLTPQNQTAASWHVTSQNQPSTIFMGSTLKGFTSTPRFRYRTTQQQYSPYNMQSVDAYFFKGKDNVLSNFYQFKFNIFHQTFTSSEAAYQYCKAVYSRSFDVALELVNARNGLAAKAIAHKIPISSTDVGWDELKYDAMKVIIYEKAEQCKPFQQFLLMNPQTKLVENTNNEYWARGQNGSGKNKLGEIIMHVRDLLLKGSLSESTRIEICKQFMNRIDNWPKEMMSRHSRSWTAPDRYGPSRRLSSLDDVRRRSHSKNSGNKRKCEYDATDSGASRERRRKRRRNRSRSDGRHKKAKRARTSSSDSSTSSSNDVASEPSSKRRSLRPKRKKKSFRRRRQESIKSYKSGRKPTRRSTTKGKWAKKKHRSSSSDSDLSSSGSSSSSGAFVKKIKRCHESSSSDRSTSDDTLKGSKAPTFRKSAKKVKSSVKTKKIKVKRKTSGRSHYSSSSSDTSQGSDSNFQDKGICLKSGTVEAYADVKMTEEEPVHSGVSATSENYDGATKEQEQCIPCESLKPFSQPESEMSLENGHESSNANQDKDQLKESGLASKKPSKHNDKKFLSKGDCKKSSTRHSVDGQDILQPVSPQSTKSHKFLEDSANDFEKIQQKDKQEQFICDVCTHAVSSNCFSKDLSEKRKITISKTGTTERCSETRTVHIQKVSRTKPAEEKILMSFEVKLPEEDKAAHNTMFSPPVCSGKEEALDERRTLVLVTDARKITNQTFQKQASETRRGTVTSCRKILDEELDQNAANKSAVSMKTIPVDEPKLSQHIFLPSPASLFSAQEELASWKKAPSSKQRSYRRESAESMACDNIYVPERQDLKLKSSDSQKSPKSADKKKMEVEQCCRRISLGQVSEKHHSQSSWTRTHKPTSTTMLDGSSDTYETRRDSYEGRRLSEVGWLDRSSDIKKPSDMDKSYSSCSQTECSSSKQKRKGNSHYVSRSAHADDCSDYRKLASHHDKSKYKTEDKYTAASGVDKESDTRSDHKQAPKYIEESHSSKGTKHRESTFGKKATETSSRHVSLSGSVVEGIVKGETWSVTLTSLGQGEKNEKMSSDKKPSSHKPKQSHTSRSSHTQEKVRPVCSEHHRDIGKTSKSRLQLLYDETALRECHKVKTKHCMSSFTSADPKLDTSRARMQSRSPKKGKYMLSSSVGEHQKSTSGHVKRAEDSVSASTSQSSKAVCKKSAPSVKKSLVAQSSESEENRHITTKVKSSRYKMLYSEVTSEITNKKKKIKSYVKSYKAKHHSTKK